MTLRAVLIGAGARAQVHLTELDRLRERGRIELVAVADPLADAAARVADPRGARSYDDAVELLESERPDVAYLVVPYNLHPQLVSVALDLGVHLFLEKPLAVDPADTARLLREADAASAAGVLTSVGYHRRYGLAVERCSQLLRDQPPAMVAGHWYWGMPEAAWARRFELSGGQLFAQMSHQIDLARHLLGEMDSVYAAAGCVGRSTEGDLEAGFANFDAQSMTVQFTSGAVGNFHCTYALLRGIPDAEQVKVICRELLVELRADHLAITRRGSDPEILSERLETGDDHLHRMHDAFLSAIEEDDPTRILTPASDAAVTSFVCAAANDSARLGRPIQMRDYIEQHTAATERARA